MVPRLLPWALNFHRYLLVYANRRQSLLRALCRCKPQSELSDLSQKNGGVEVQASVRAEGDRSENSNDLKNLWMARNSFPMS
jgi:hypothetical protein